MDSGGDMSGHRLPRLLAPSPRCRPYVLVSVCKGIIHFLNTQKKFKEIFKKYLILLILNDLQKAFFGTFSGFPVVKRFNGIILYIGDLRPWQSPCPVSWRIPYKAEHDTDKARTTLKRFTSAVRTPGAMIDRTKSDKRN